LKTGALIGFEQTRYTKNPETIF